MITLKLYTEPGYSRYRSNMTTCSHDRVRVGAGAWLGVRVRVGVSARVKVRVRVRVRAQNKKIIHQTGVWGKYCLTYHLVDLVRS